MMFMPRHLLSLLVGRWDAGELIADRFSALDSLHENGKYLLGGSDPIVDDLALGTFHVRELAPLHGSVAGTSPAVEIGL